MTVIAGLFPLTRHLMLNPTIFESKIFFYSLSIRNTQKTLLRILHFRVKIENSIKYSIVPLNAIKSWERCESAMEMSEIDSNLSNFRYPSYNRFKLRRSQPLLSAFNFRLFPSRSLRLKSAVKKWLLFPFFLMIQALLRGPYLEP